MSETNGNAALATTIDVFRQTAGLGDNPTAGQVYRENFGNGEIPEELEWMDYVPVNEAIEVAGQTGGEILESTLQAVAMIIAATTAQIPVVGWVAAAAILIANLFTAGKAWNSNWDDAKASNRRVLDNARRFVEELGYIVPPDVREGTGSSVIVGPGWGAGDYRAAWWYLRFLEVACVEAGSYLDSAKGGAFRVGTAYDVVTGRASGGNWQALNEGYPYIRFIDANDGGRLLLASGSRLKFQEYARGIFHASTTSSRAQWWDTIVDFFAGADRKVKRRMAALEAASSAMLAGLKELKTASARRWYAANLILSSEQAWIGRGVKFTLNSPDPIKAWAEAGIPAAPPPNTITPGEAGVIDYPLGVILEENSAPYGVVITVVQAIGKRRMFFYRQIRSEERNFLGFVVEPLAKPRLIGGRRIQTSPDSPVAVFVSLTYRTIENPWTGYDGPGPAVLVDYRMPTREGFNVVVNMAMEHRIERDKGVDPYPEFFRTALPWDHAGSVWLRSVAPTLQAYAMNGYGNATLGPIVPPTRALWLLRQRMADAGTLDELDEWIERRGEDRARGDDGTRPGEGIGLGGIALGALAVWAATRS